MAAGQQQPEGQAHLHEARAGRAVEGRALAGPDLAHAPVGADGSLKIVLQVLAQQPAADPLVVLDEVESPGKAAGIRPADPDPTTVEGLHAGGGTLVERRRGHRQGGLATHWTLAAGEKRQQRDGCRRTIYDLPAASSHPRPQQRSGPESRPG